MKKVVLPKKVRPFLSPRSISIDKSNGYIVFDEATDDQLILSGLTLSQDEKGFLIIENPEFSTLFFLALNALTDKDIPLSKGYLEDAIDTWPTIRGFLKDITIEVDGHTNQIQAYTYSIYNEHRVMFVGVTPEEKERAFHLAERVKDGTITADESAELKLLNSRGQYDGEDKKKLLIKMMDQQLEKPVAKRAMFLALRVLLGQFNATEESSPKINKLFSNSRDIAENEWGLPKLIADNLSKGIRAAKRDVAIGQFAGNGRAHTTAIYQIQGRRKEDTDTELIFDKKALAINTAEQFANQLLKVKDAKVLQTFFALWKWANIQDTAVFRNVPISEIMELVLHARGVNKFNTDQRRSFSEILKYLDSISINVRARVTERNPKSGKEKQVLQEERGVKLFRLVATYSVKREYQSLPKDELLDEHFDQSVITKITGELLPGHQYLFGDRGSIYFDSLLKLDGNKDSKAILLGFTIQTRFNQNQDKEKCIELDRGYLIDLCDYAKTNQVNASKATSQIANSLNKLRDAGIIDNYSGLTNNDTDRVRISPPKQKVIS